MPSQQPLPTVEAFRNAFIDAVRVQRSRADNVTGASYDYFNGTAAILWSQEVQFTRDLFRAIYLDDADGPGLSDRIEKIWNVLRVTDAYGTGAATFSRSSASAGAETFHAGTRLRVGEAFYAVSAETTASASALYAVVPIRAAVFGPGTAIASPAAAIDDALADPSWTCTGLTCGDGTLFEKAPDYRARARSLRVASRVGYQTQIVLACQQAGAAYVAAFPATAFGTGYGAQPGYPQPYSAVYTGDASYAGNQALTNRVTLALEGARALGAEVAVGRMTPTPLAVTARVFLWDQPALFDLNQLTNVLRGALLASFYAKAQGGFVLNRDSLAASMQRVSSAIQSVDFSAPAGDLGILTGSPPHFPASLPRYQLTASAINFTFLPPQ